MSLLLEFGLANSLAGISVSGTDFAETSFLQQSMYEHVFVVFGAGLSAGDIVRIIVLRQVKSTS